MRLLVCPSAHQNTRRFPWAQQLAVCEDGHSHTSEAVAAACTVAPASWVDIIPREIGAEAEAEGEPYGDEDCDPAAPPTKENLMETRTVIQELLPPAAPSPLCS
ncbi:hypothetical protein TREES_T100015923 [Tupaia chinensis]|uniref:Uncharacterized protein n=1 Tax=Tupaia chinensis TaxID=246437 RepID=L9KXN7_TUPCH|nr:hypothetical protein TREES_T100015923 [Tupaia chinensis]